MRVLVIGASGLIGSAVATRLAADGHMVVAAARSGPGGAASASERLRLDLRSMTKAADWLPHLEGIDAVVNCAGVLQDGDRDRVAAVHAAAPMALFAACEAAGVARVVHLSAIGIDRETPTPFSATKLQGDRALMATGLAWVILRPSVVLGRGAYGASALIRGLAVLPVVPSLGESGKLQVVQLDDLVATIAFFLKTDAPTRIALEIAGPDRLAFDDVVAAYRHWLGRPSARRVALPRWLMGVLFRLGDLAGRLGWRPPIRSTAAREMLRGAVGDPAPWTAMTGIVPRSLTSALAAEPATVQEKWFARLYFVRPLALAVFALFWLATAFMSLGPGWDIGLAYLRQGGLTGMPAAVTVVAGALADLCIGLAIVWRRTTRIGLWAAFALSLVYVVVGTGLVPGLWIDPLGPMLKIWPILALNLILLAILEER